MWGEPAGSAPSFLNNLVQAYASPLQLPSTHEPDLVKPSVHTWRSRVFSYLVPHGGTTSGHLSEQGHIPVLQKALEVTALLRAQVSLQPSYSSSYLLLLLTNLHSPALLVGSCISSWEDNAF